jgi:hypothetical protein
MRHALTLFIVLVISGIGNLYAKAGKSDSLYVKNFTTEDYQAHHQNWAIIQDKRGIMNFGNPSGILEFDGTYWRLIKIPNDLGIYSFAMDNEQRIYVGGQGEIGYLAPDKMGSMQYISLLNRLPENERKFLDRIFQIQITDDAKYFVSEKKIYRLRNESLKIFQTDDHYFSSIFAKGFFFVIDGAHGLMQLINDSLKVVPGGELIRSYMMLPYKQNKVLIITPYKGIVEFIPPAPKDYKEKNKSLTKFLKPWKKQVDNFFLENKISSGIVLDNGSLALGTIQNGFVVVDTTGKIIQHIDTKSGILNNDIYGINKDKDGNIWLAMDNGIAFLNLSSSMQRFTQQKTDSTTASSGMIVDTAKVKFATVLRKFELVKNDSLIFGGAFYKTINGVTVLQQPQALSLTFPYFQNAFRFTFSSNFYQDIDKIEYQCYLEGLDDNWSTWSRRTVKEYTNLYWGKYKFRVRARNFQQEISREAVYSFRIIPPWFETWWFYTAQVVLFFSFLVIAGFLNKKGKALGLSNYLTNIVVVIIFKYVNMAISPLIGSLYSGGVAIFKIVMSILTGTVLNPIQSFVSKMMFKLTAKKKNVAESTPQPLPEKSTPENLKVSETDMEEAVMETDKSEQGRSIK